MKSSLFKALVVHSISTALPMQHLHQLAALAYKNIHISISRVKTNASYLPTQLVYTGTHIAWMLRHNDAIIFIKIEHNFFTAKLAQPHAWRKSAYFGWLLFFSLSV